VDSQARKESQASQEKLAMRAQKEGAQQECKRKEVKSNMVNGMDKFGFFGPGDKPLGNRANGRKPNGFAARNRK
jgi:hypothetical protein